jgi:FkbM family methyltransferase
VRDLLIITPTRGRPGGARRLIHAVAATATAKTSIVLGIDDDDPSYDDFTPSAGVIIARGPRASLSGWSNRLAAEHGYGYRALASFGDDHAPRTPGWDTAMLAALDAMGGHGIVYGNDMAHGANLPTAAVLSSSVVAALGWMCLPAAAHFFVDNAWKDLGEQAGCLRYLPDVTIEHLHHLWGKAPHDGTYAHPEPGFPLDHAAYDAWVRDGLAGDAAKIRALRPGRRTEAQTEDYLWEGAAGDLAFDVGANIGQSVTRMLGSFSRVVAFEPATESFTEAHRAHGDDRRVTLLPLAVCGHEGSLFLDVRSAPILSGQLTATGMPYRGEHAGEPSMANWGPVTGYREIACTTLDAIAAQYGDPDFVKIDTEGHEVQVLRGAAGLLARRRPPMTVEFHTASLRDECARILGAAGYQVEVVEPVHFPEGSHMRENYGWLKCRT